MGDKIRLNLTGLDKIGPRTRDEVIVGIRKGLGPIVSAAGKTLVITVGGSSGDLNLEFDSHTKTTGSDVCAISFLGEDSGESVFVKAHKELRVCGPVDSKGKRDTRRVLTASWLLGPALANTAMHELGHFIAGLDHVGDSSNFMSTMGPPKEKRTLESQRAFWAGKQKFTEEQKAKLIERLEKGVFVGDEGFTVQGHF